MNKDENIEFCRIPHRGIVLNKRKELFFYSFRISFFKIAHREAFTLNKNSMLPE